MPQEFPISQHQIYFTEKEDSTQGQKSQGGSKAESHSGVEDTAVSWRKEETDQNIHICWDYI